MLELKNIFSNRSSRLFRLRRFIPRVFLQRRQKRVSTQIFNTKARIRDFFSLRQKVLIIVTVFIVSSTIGLTYYSKFFSVSKVSVLRSSLDLPLTEIEAIVREYAFGKNILQLDTKKLSQDIQTTRPDISRVIITKQYPSTLQVAVYKYPIVAELRVGTDRIFINENGYRVDGEMPDRDTFGMVLGEQVDLSDTNKQIVKPEYLISMRNAAFYFEALTDLSVISVRYYPIAREAHLIVDGNFEIWLDLTKDYRNQLDKLTAAGNKLDLTKKNYRYIDLRIRNKIFYKNR